MEAQEAILLTKAEITGLKRRYLQLRFQATLGIFTVIVNGARVGFKEADSKENGVGVGNVFRNVYTWTT